MEKKVTTVFMAGDGSIHGTRSIAQQRQREIELAEFLQDSFPEAGIQLLESIAEVLAKERNKMLTIFGYEEED